MVTVAREKKKKSFKSSVLIYRTKLNELNLVIKVITKRMTINRKLTTSAEWECVLFAGGDTFLGEKRRCVQMSHDVSTLPGTYWALRLEQRMEQYQHVVR